MAHMGLVIMGGRCHSRQVRDDLEQHTDVEYDSGYDCRDHNRVQDPDGWVSKSVKIDAPTFHGQMDPHAFLDWLSNMNH